MVKSIPDQNNKADMIGTGPIRFGTFSPAPDRQYISKETRNRENRVRRPALKESAKAEAA